MNPTITPDQEPSVRRRSLDTKQRHWPICAGDFANGSVAMIGRISTWDPPTAEQDSARATFALAQLGFTPSEVVEDQAGWRDFLRRKYSTIDSLNSSHDANWDDFDSIPIPTDQPENQTASDDWQVCRHFTSNPTA